MSILNRKLSSIITINFDSLIDIIEAIQLKNDNLNDHMQDVMNKMSSLTDFREDIDNIKYKTNSVYTKMSTIEDSMNSHSKKFLDNDQRIQAMESIVNQTEGSRNEKDKSIKDMEERLIAHETNLNNLNRVVEESVKGFDKEKEKNIQLTEELHALEAKLLNNEEEVKAIRANTVENVKRLELIYESHDAASKELEARLNKKLNECDKRMNLIIDKMNQLHNIENHMHSHSHNHNESLSPSHNETPRIEEQQQGVDNNNNTNTIQSNNEEKRNSTINKSKEDSNSNRKEDDEENKAKQQPRRLSIITGDDQQQSKSEETLRIDEVVREIAKIQATIESVRLDEFRHKENTDEEIQGLKQKIGQINNPIDNLPDFNVINQGSHQLDHKHEENYAQTAPVIIFDENFDQKNNSNNKSDEEKDGISSKDRQIIENLKQLANGLETKATKDELASANQNLIKEIDSLTHKLTESLHQYDTKLKLIANISKGSGQAIDPEALTQSLNAQITSVLNSSAKDLIQTQIADIDLLKNESYNQAMQTLQNHTEELNKTYESLVDIRNNLLSKQVEDQVSSLLGRMTEVETGFRKVKFDVDELTKSLEEDVNAQAKDGSDANNSNAKSLANQVSLRETVNILTSKLITINDKVEKLEKKQTDIHKNILLIVKQDLKNESNRILEEFKSDLKISIAKIEDQLREKVDRFNLAEFSHRIDNKLNSEMKRKLDRMDLNKNNSVINRKIDSLEDKISKQFVDTLIDLQLEEAPLIVKKTMKPYDKDKCASCNQTLPQRNNYYLGNMAMSTEGNYYSKYKNSKYVGKDKLPDINSNI